MLPTWMIEKLQRDRRAREERERIRAELELPRPPEDSGPREERREGERGAVVIQVVSRPARAEL